MLAAIANRRFIARDGFKDIFGKEISRLHARGPIGTGPRSFRRGAPYTYVTADQFMVAVNLLSLQVFRILSSSRMQARAMA